MTLEVLVGYAIARCEKLNCDLEYGPFYFCSEECRDAFLGEQFPGAPRLKYMKSIDTELTGYGCDNCNKDMR